MPHMKMPHVKMPNVDISLPKGKIEGPDIDIALPKGKIEGPDVDISLPKGKIEGPEMDIKGEGGRFKMPHLSMPSVDISLPKGKVEGPDAEIEGGSGGKFKMPHMKMPNVDISLPKGKVQGPDVDISLPKGKTEGPNVDIALPKGKIESPDVEIEGGSGGKFKMPYWKVPDVEIKGDGEGKFKMPHMKMPNVDISLPKGKYGKIEGVELEIQGEGGKSKIPEIVMPSVDISLPKGKTEGPKAEIKGEGGKFKMPKVDISLPKGKPSIECPEVEIKGDGGQFKMPNVDLSIPKGKTNIDTPEMKVEAEGGAIKLPHIKMPKVDILLPKGKDIEAPAIELEVTGRKIKGPDIKLPKEAGGKIIGSQVTSPDLDISVTHSKPKQDTEAHVEGDNKGMKLKMPTIDIKGPKGDLELDIGLQRGEGKKDRKKVELPDLDLNTAGASSKVKGPKVKGTKFKIGMPKKKTGKNETVEVKICKDCGNELDGQEKHKCKAKERLEYEVEVETHNGHKGDKGRSNVTVPKVTLPSVQGSANVETGGDGAVRVPMIPDIEFDIGTSHEEDDGKTENGKKIKIPKFGVPLPSISSPEGRMNIYGPEIQYEGPKMPKVKKAVFVLVDSDEPTARTGLLEEEMTCEAETEDIKVKMPKIKMKPSFGKSKDKSATGEDKSKGLEMKMPQVSFSSGKSGSLDVKGSSSSLNGEQDASPHKGSKDDKGTFSGKIKLPKLEFTSPYGKMAAEEEDSSPGEVGGDTKALKIKPGKMAFAGFSEESMHDVVSSHARTDMLDRDSSESPSGFSMEYSSTKFQPWSVESQSTESEERESSSWFKVPKFSLKPHSTGFLQITPEGSPQAQRRGELGGEVDVSGSFCLTTSGLDFSTQEMSEERQVSSTEEASVTMVTKTTRITRQMVTTETRTGESSSTTTTTTRQVTDF